MNFMNADVYSMMDELGELVQALKERERPSTPSPDISALQPLIDAVDIVMTKVAALWQEVVAVIKEAVSVLVPLVCRLVDSFGRWHLYKKLKCVIGKRAAWYLAERCPAWLLWRLV